MRRGLISDVTAAVSQQPQRRHSGTLEPETANDVNCPPLAYELAFTPEKCYSVIVAKASKPHSPRSGIFLSTPTRTRSRTLGATSKSVQADWSSAELSRRLPAMLTRPGWSTACGRSHFPEFPALSRRRRRSTSSVIATDGYTPSTSLMRRAWLPTLVPTFGDAREVLTSHSLTLSDYKMYANGHINDNN